MNILDENIIASQRQLLLGAGLILALGHLAATLLRHHSTIPYQNHKPLSSRIFC